MLVLPRPEQLSTLGAVLCLHRAQAGGELAGWSQAVRVVSSGEIDSDGLCESMQFFDQEGRCCWRLFLLPDTDFLAWEDLVAGLPQQRATETALTLAERLWRRVANRLGNPGWQASVLRFHTLAAWPGFAGMPLLAASLPRLSACGAEAARRILRATEIEADDLFDDCSCRRTSIHTTEAAEGDIGWRWPPGFNTGAHT
jgi:hypothetical protein